MAKRKTVFCVRSIVDILVLFPKEMTNRNTVSTSQVVQYLGFTGLRRLKPFINFVTSGCSPTGHPSTVLWYADIADLAFPMALWL